MEIHELRSLTTLARTRSITRTAELLHLTPSAIHRHLRLLSEELDVELYEARGRTLHLTAAAETLLPLAQDLLLQCQSIKSAAEELKQLKRGRVRVGAGPSFSSYLLPALLERYRRRFPDVDVLLEAGHTPQLMAELADGALDVVFLIAQPGVERTFLIEASWDFEVQLVAGPTFAAPRRASLRRLAACPFLLFKQGSYFEQQIDLYFARYAFVPNVAMRLDNAEPIKALVRSGFGIALLPEWAIRREIESGELVRIHLRATPLRSCISMFRRRTKHVSAALAAFIQMGKAWSGKG